ncbi:cyclodeaminase/cyclohydrolase family protein [Clostridium butyricum]|uniref:Formiminotransferase-cyclodeaminase n=1 Tax=Clostridium butyricum E4 str. BoNT E BL5262 TaxID=632245 RepID=C4IHY0_CLOBU|nr:cyclodeaminase/cyclohydrolase family protein [Clostridium butyricum]APF23377.1 formiminotransferase-cyclodeaminase family protein [Clostridium butyricum]EDT76518.1 methenyltetrahydrofolate cyclohydrolase [Clostridium butyricum 5521]EEP53944.1 formiminotransferase-cyclodeaminase [Clostridium butyricum E4 str. BoNT E BL5262]NFL32400.1 cyclodeaminase/cyclohydrolase family protein [Clostridium butyricum]NFS18681.1 cyclodeaminase/cyclohydrolase family protein [Clostridium butyricum]
MKFCDDTIKKFINDLESDMPAPGGGSVAGLIAALSGALNSMVYSLTVGKKSYMALDEKTQDVIRKFQAKSLEFSKRSLEIMDEDRENFLKLMDCYKMPKDNDEEKEIRKKAIKENTIKSMEAPLALARECVIFYENLKVMAEYGNKMLLSDLGISAILLHSAIESSIINVKVNLNGLRSEEFFEELDKELIKMLEISIEEKNKISEIVDKVIYA